MGPLLLPDPPLCVENQNCFHFFKEKVYLLRIIFYAVLHLYNLGTQPTFFRLKLFAQIPNIQFQQVVRKLDETVNWKKFSREQFRNSADGVERQHMILGIKSTDLTQVILAVSSKFPCMDFHWLSSFFFFFCSDLRLVEWRSWSSPRSSEHSFRLMEGSLVHRSYQCRYLSVYCQGFLCCSLSLSYQWDHHNRNPNIDTEIIWWATNYIGALLSYQCRYLSFIGISLESSF